MIIRILPFVAVVLCQFGQPTDNYSQNNQYNQNQYGSMNSDNSRGIINRVLTPYNTTNNNPPFTEGVTIQFQLRGYSDPGSALPNGYTCVCPQGRTCTYLKEAPTCYFGFTFIISSPDQSVRHLATDFFTLDQNGNLPQMVGNSRRWDENYIVQLPSKPSAIDIFAHHMGAVINQQDGSIVTVDSLTHVDTFVVPLAEVLPAVGGVQSMNQQNSYTGKLLGTSLSLSYSIACTGQLIGPDCDFTCTKSAVNSNVAACTSNSTGFFSVCNYQTGGEQVANCKNCPWGIRDGTYCQDDEGEVLDPHTAGVVDPSFKTATIILGITVGILFILLIITIIMACLMRKRNKTEQEMTTYNRNEGPANRPLLQASYRHDDPPTPLPRSTPPSLDARPIKSALRKPMIPQNSSNDTRDTSFSNDVPMRPSKSEVV